MSEKHIQFNKDWGSWAKGYLRIAELGFLYLKSQPHIGRSKIPNSSSPPIYFLANGSLIIASIWNIKHGIELLIKALGIKADKKYKEGHNLNTLITSLDGKLRGYCIDKHFQLLKTLVIKYYECNFSKKTKFLDMQNTLFKYPETILKNSLQSFSLDYSFVHDLSKKDINQFLTDIHNLRRVFEILEGQHKHFETWQNFGMSNKAISKGLSKVYTIKNPGFK